MMNHDKRILLVCANGMSTSMLVQQMNDWIKMSKLNYEVKCCDVVSAMIEIYNSDLVLLAPQISYVFERMKPLAKALKIPLEIMDIESFRKFDGKSMLDSAIQLLDLHKATHPFQIIFLSPTNGGVLLDLIMMDMKKYIKSQQMNILVENENIQNFIPSECRANVVLLESQYSYLMNNVFPYLKKHTASGIVTKELSASFNGRFVLEFALKCYDELLEERKREMIAQEGEQHEINC